MRAVVSGVTDRTDDGRDAVHDRERSGGGVRGGRRVSVGSAATTSDHTASNAPRAPLRRSISDTDSYRPTLVDAQIAARATRSRAARPPRPRRKISDTGHATMCTHTRASESQMRSADLRSPGFEIDPIRMCEATLPDG